MGDKPPHGKPKKVFQIPGPHPDAPRRMREKLTHPSRVQIGPSHDSMKVTVRSAPQFQYLRIAGGEGFFVKHQHPVFHVFDVVVSGGVVTTVVEERLGDESNLEQASDAITEVPVLPFPLQPQLPLLSPRAS